MDCRPSDPTDREDFFRAFSRKTEARRIPLSGSIEVTRRCNFSCVHCYLGGKAAGPASAELDTAAWMKIIDDIAAAGCLFLLFTGGEPLLRPDFPDLYRHARKCGLIVTVFSNGSLITDALVELFAEFPPHAVEITLYGATEETYARITGRPGMFARVMAGIERLAASGVRARLKSVLMTLNCGEFFQMEQIAADLGLGFRFDPAIFPCLDGNPGPLQYRVSPQEAVEKELASHRRRSEWRVFAQRMKGVTLSGDLYDCSAGLNNFHIDPSGDLQPCLMVTDVRYNVQSGRFIEGWREVIPDVRRRRIDPTFGCRGCENRIFCGFCPAFFRLESGSETEVSTYLCTLGHAMAEAIAAMDIPGGRCAVE